MGGSKQRKPTGFAFTLCELEERTIMSLVSGVVSHNNQGSSPSILGVVNGALYFSANDGIDGTQLWKTDGTAAGTAMVTDLPQTDSPITAETAFPAWLA